MTIVAEFTIPPDAIPGGDALAAMPELTVELERVVPTGESALPFFWVFGGDPSAFLTRVRAEPDIEDLQVLATVDNAALFSATWTPHCEVTQGIRTLRATIVQATGTAEEWHFQVRAQSRDRLLEFQRIFQHRDIPIQLRRIYDLSEMLETRRRLTDEQRETLIVAYENGYFERPREITQAELGAHFGISSQAIANRLQRGIRNLVRSTLLAPGGVDGGRSRS